MARKIEFATWLNWSELLNKPRLTLEQFRADLRTYPRTTVLIECAKLSAELKYGPDAKTVASASETLRLIPRLFPAALVPRLNRYAGDGRVIFFQGQLRFLAAEMLRVRDSTVDDQASMPENFVGPLLLACAELLNYTHKQLPDNLDVMANLIAEFLPTYEIDSPTDPLLLFLRFMVYLKVLIPALPPHRQTYDIPAVFSEVFGFTLRRYCLFIFMTTMRALIDRSSTPVLPSMNGALTRQAFGATNLTEHELSQLFSSVCRSIEDLPDPRPTAGIADFESLKDQPYFQHEEVLFCLDYEYAVGRLEGAVLWRVARAQRNADTYISYWGYVFEAYVEWLFSNYAHRTKNRFYREPCFQDKIGLPICDSIVICGNTAVVIEAKLGTFRADVRYSGNHGKVREQLEKKLVAVGVNQLVDAVENITTHRASVLPAFLKDIREFIPVLITRDDIGSSWMTNAYLNSRFQGGLNRNKRYSIWPMVSMSISTLERLMAALGDRSFTQILEERIQADRKLSHPFEAASKFARRGTARKIHAHLGIMQTLITEMVEEFGMADDSKP